METQGIQTQSADRQIRYRSFASSGATQMSIVEHALCPLDSNVTLQNNFNHEASYFFTDKHRNRKKASVRVSCPNGISANDELYLWGLLAITLAHDYDNGQLIATPHYCLRRLGFFEDGTTKGGRNYEVFRDAIERLAAVTYQNDHFYDPVRGEHRKVGFSFLSYSLPLDEQSSRAYRISFDPVFYEFCQATGSALSFDLATYRQLDSASRRLYLLLKKVFWRHELSQEFELRHLAIDVLGFANSLPTWKLKQKLVRCIRVLLDIDALRLPLGTKTPADLFEKRGNLFAIRFQRGPHFDKHSPNIANKELQDSPFFDQLQEIGFEVSSIRRILGQYEARLVAEWIDITLAARERNGASFFTTGPEAYFLDNIRHAAEGRRTPPDWWRQLRVAEERKKRVSHLPEQQLGHASQSFDEYLKTEARDAFDHIMGRIFSDLTARGIEEAEARAHAEKIARSNMRAQFNRNHGIDDDSSPQRAFDLLRPGNS